ncbi:MAG: hypothetical protein GSR85_01260 [Desulfurococcales archaeon]|nr:hypothetical protein [Desulfurococcales archaeon]
MGGENQRRGVKIVSDKEGKPIVALSGREKIETSQGSIEIKEIHEHEYSKERPGTHQPTSLPTSGHIKITVETSEGTKSGKVGDVIGEPITEIIKKAQERLKEKKNQD